MPGEYTPGKEEGRRRRRGGQRVSSSEKPPSQDGAGADGKQPQDGGDVGVRQDSSPRSSADLVNMNENLLDKLKLLNYDTRFCSKYKLEPLTHIYFAYPGSTSEQLHYFANLFSWLLSLAKTDYPAPDQYDDPNQTVKGILSHLRKMRVHEDVTQSDLLSGSGEAVLAILNTVAQNAMKHEKFQWSRPVFPAESFRDEVMEDDVQEVNMTDAGGTGVDGLDDDDIIEDEVEDSDGDDVFADVDVLHRHEATPTSAPVKELLKADIDAATWRIEVERVLPQLKVHIRSNDKDWRTHVEQMQQYESSISGSMSGTQSKLEKLQGDITKTLDKIESREKYVNKQLEPLIREFREHHDKLASTQEKYKQSGSSVTEQTRELADLTDSLDAIKAQMDERGTSMTDAGPLVKIKQALTRLKTETDEMELRIGVLQHTLMRARTQEQKTVAHDMHRNQHIL